MTSIQVHAVTLCRYTIQVVRCCMLQSEQHTTSDNLNCVAAKCTAWIYMLVTFLLQNKVGYTLERNLEWGMADISPNC